MGGQAFAQPGPHGEPSLKTPRMSPHVHNHLTQKCQQVLSKHYNTVASLKNAPGKVDYGDIDFLVQGPFPGTVYQQLVTDLEAKRILNNNLHLTLAIPWPAEDSTFIENDAVATTEEPPRASLHEESNLTSSTDKTQNGTRDNAVYAQLDVRILPAGQSISWLLYLNSYGDLGQILGYFSYDLGLTSNDRGFFVRIAEQERTHWQGSMIFLSQSPEQVMQFLNLDFAAYERGFETEQALFDWVRTSRTARRRLTQEATAADSDLGRHRDESTDHKRRLQTRPMFARFMSNVFPTLPEFEVDTSTARQELLRSALVFFDKEAEYEERLAQVLARNEDEKARLLLVGLLTEVTKLAKDKVNEIIRGLRHWVASSTDVPSDCRCRVRVSSTSGCSNHPQGTPVVLDDHLTLRTQPAMDPSEQIRLGDLLNSTRDGVDKDIAKWLEQNWMKVRELEREMKKAKMKKYVEE